MQHVRNGIAGTRRLHELHRNVLFCSVLCDESTMCSILMLMAIEDGLSFATPSRTNVPQFAMFCGRRITLSDKQNPLSASKSRSRTGPWARGEDASIQDASKYGFRAHSGASVRARPGVPSLPERAGERRLRSKMHGGKPTNRSY